MPLGCLGTYEILERVGEGGVGVVFRARDTRLNRVVALKVLSESLSSDAELRARLLREARAEACLSHPNIATCFEIGAAAPQPPDLIAPGGPGPHPELVYYLAMEYVPGRDLLQMIEEKPLPIARVLDLAVQIASGLEAAHAAHVIHRDLKPGNVRVTPEGQVKILDFGLARIWSTKPPGGETPSFQTSEGRVMGTAAYMSPEQARGDAVDARSDLFGLGVLLYQTVTGKLPFTGQSAIEIFHAASTEEPQPLSRYASGVPEELERIVRKLLEKEPRNRYQSAHEALTDLARLRDGRTPVTRSHARDARSGRGAAILLLAGLLIAIVAAAAWWTMPWRLKGAPSRTLAVLPFENATGDTTLEAVSAGLAEDLRNGLVQHTDVNVVSRGATAALPKGDRTPRTVAHELGVGAMLTGTVRRESGSARLEVELVDTHTGFVRWSETYDLSAGQALRSEQDMVQRVAARLRAKTDLAGTGHKPVTTSALHAYDEYLIGVKELQDADDPQAEDRAADHFAAALSQDPEFSLALAGRARALLRIYKRDKQPETLRSAELTADQAIQLAPDLLEARIARSEILRVTGHFDEAIRDLEEVVARRPHWDEGCVQLAATYRDAGRLAEAETWYRKAVALRPDYWKNWNSLGAILFRRGDYAGAREAFAQIVRLVPDKNRGYEQLAAVDVKMGKIDQAIAEYRRLPTPVADGVLASNLGTALYYDRRLKEAEEFYRLAVRVEPNTAMFRQNLGDCLNREGRVDEARDSYRDAVRLAEDDLRMTPQNPELRLARAVYLAKAGECAEAKRAIDEVSPHLPQDVSDYAYRSAMVNSLCGRRAQALDALRRAIALGMPAQTAAEDDEFLALRDDPEFRRLTGGRAPAPARPGAGSTGRP